MSFFVAVSHGVFGRGWATHSVLCLGRSLIRSVTVAVAVLIGSHVWLADLDSYCRGPQHRMRKEISFLDKPRQDDGDLKSSYPVRYLEIQS